MDSSPSLICLDVQFDDVSAKDAVHAVPAAADVPEFGASCGPLTTQLSCECDGGPCDSPEIEPA